VQKLATLMALLISFTSVAETVSLGSFYISGMSESPDKGRFVDVAKRVASEAGYKAEILFYPAQRTREAFAQGKLDGMFPALRPSMQSRHYATDSLLNKRIYAFSRSGDLVVRELKDLGFKRIGLTRGFTYSVKLLNIPGASYQETILLPQNIKKLVAGRIDVFLGDESSTLVAIQEEGAEGKVTHDPAAPLDEIPVYFAFRPDERGKKLAADFSAAIQRLKQSGELQRILSGAMSEVPG